MRIGIVSYWFNRGQATVARHLRSALEELGYETVVLARPTRDKFVMPQFVAATDVWCQEGVTVASRYDIPASEYLAFVAENRLDALMLDQNYQFDEIRKVREQGVATIGRFVWEAFAESHVASARDAYTVIYSLTQCERERYRYMGIDSPYIPWGCHPELIRYRQQRENSGSEFMYVGGHLSKRKPTGAVVEAFQGHNRHDSRLIIKSQRDVRPAHFAMPQQLSDLRNGSRVRTADIKQDSRISLMAEDLDLDSYYRFFSNCDVAIAPSRWEGLGLHLYEAIAFGVPTISCDIPPINEVITHGVDGLLVSCRPLGRRKNGLMAYEPDVGELRRAIEKLSDPGTARRMADNTSKTLQQRAWAKTVSGLNDLLASVA